ncbi:hypothetical protein TW95_gp1533 [Pandoravirus inopinatum]|uniref:Uncharacterized protein n=1 Tax=Pandoravirus inopinatum TaxID=1605721 RepID=A0A0B5JEQ8_9VIRU|nr:hypothetical protein TW95_gp1533 [Pandoravirus inopinatum]AJF98267.1 hypothetical protein [Pandoravirus inopinatum]
MPRARGASVQANRRSDARHIGTAVGIADQDRCGPSIESGAVQRSRLVPARTMASASMQIARPATPTSAKKPTKKMSKRMVVPTSPLAWKVASYSSFLGAHADGWLCMAAECRGDGVLFS